MIGKFLSNKSVVDTANYNVKDGSEIIATYNLAGNCIADYLKQMSLTQELFAGSAKNLTAHIILSPSIEDGKKQTAEDWKEISTALLKKAKLDKHESVVFLHKDKGHIHLHVISNRIDSSGNIYRNGNELKLIQSIANQIAAERGLIQAKEIMLERKRLKKQGIEFTAGGSINKLQKELKEIIKQVIITNRSFDQEKYFMALRAKEFEVKKHFHNETGALRGYGIKKNGNYFNASVIGSEFTLTFLRNPELAKQIVLQQEQDLLMKQFDEREKRKREKKRQEKELKEREQSEMGLKIKSIPYSQPINDEDIEQSERKSKGLNI